MFKRLNLLKIDDIFTCQCMSFYHKYVNNNVPLFCKSLFTCNATHHEYHTRHNLQLVIPYSHTSRARKSLRYHLPSLLRSMPQSGSAQNPRNPRMFSNLSFLFKYPRLFSNLTQCSRMFSKRNVLKMPLFWPYIGVRNLPIRQHPVKKGANRTAAEQMLGSRRPRVTLTSRAEVAPKRKRPMAASDIN